MHSGRNTLQVHSVFVLQEGRKSIMFANCEPYSHSTRTARLNHVLEYVQTGRTLP